jgi:molybdate transport system ATP-binding protein
MIDVDVRFERDDFSLQVAFTAPPGSVTALFGASGAGKSTLLDIVGGALRPASGHVRYAGATLTDTARDFHVPVEERGIGWVFQEGLLFPHLDVHDNLNFAARRAKAGLQIPRARILEVLGLGALLRRRPHELSGGERQRVAIARALLSRPRLMLLDEPLASLDAPRKLEILALLETLRREFAVPMLYVTHSLGEVLRLADHMVVLERGRAVASGAIGDLFGRTDTPLLSERADAGALLDLQVIANDRAGSVTARIGAQTMVVAADVRVGTNLRAYVLANEVILASARPTGISVRNVLQSVVTRLAHRNDGSVMVELALGETDSPHRLLANVTLAAARELGLAPGQAVHALIKTVSVDAPAGARAIGTG